MAEGQAITGNLKADKGPRKKRIRQAETQYAEEESTGINADEEEGSAMDVDSSPIDDACELLQNGCLKEARKLVFSTAALNMLNNGPSTFFHQISPSHCAV